jgi:uncharacterized membrane protein
LREPFAASIKDVKRDERRSSMEKFAPHPAALGQARGTARLEAFSDGVFAIAITLLVLDLTVPSNLSPITPLTLAAALVSRWPNYLTLGISFATILIMWVNHHHLFKAARQTEPLLLFSNGLLLLFVTLVPFPTALVGAYLTTPAASVACAIYAGFFVLVHSAYSLLWWAISRQQPRDRLPTKGFSRSMLISFLCFLCYLIATAVAFWSPLLTVFICGVLWIVWAMTLLRPRIDVIAE